jgi:sugar phosphate permease
MKRDEYVSGEKHSFWAHFVLALFVGVIPGGWISGHIFDSTRAVVISTVVLVLTFAICCGLWGNSAWEFLSQVFDSCWWW